MTTASVRFPDVTIYADDETLSTFGLLTRVVNGLKARGHEDAIEQFYSDAAACTDHADVLRLVRATVRTI
jgi:hypothetical protein